MCVVKGGSVDQFYVFLLKLLEVLLTGVVYLFFKWP